MSTPSEEENKEEQVRVAWSKILDEMSNMDLIQNDKEFAREAGCIILKHMKTFPNISTKEWGKYTKKNYRDVRGKAKDSALNAARRLVNILKEDSDEEEEQEEKNANTLSEPKNSPVQHPHQLQ